jgi:hypothetical protein
VNFTVNFSVGSSMLGFVRSLVRGGAL